MEMWIMEKAKKIHREKTLGWFSLELFFKFLTTLAMNEKCRALFKYGNAKYISWNKRLKNL